MLRRHDPQHRRLEHLSDTDPPSCQREVLPERDVGRVRQRYLKQSKVDLVERLLIVEQAYAENQQQLARLQFELLEIQQKRGEGRQQARQP